MVQVRTPAPAQDAAMQQNFAARERLLATAIRSSQTLPGQAFGVGLRRTYELSSVGILRYLLVTFRGTVRVTGGTTSPTWSDKAPWNIIDRVEFRDLAGVSRVSATAFMLKNLVELNKFVGETAFTPISYPGHSPLGYNLPAIPAVDTDYPLVFSFPVPIAYDEDDLRGAMVLAVPNAKAYLELTFNSSVHSAADHDSVLVGGNRTAHTITGTVEVAQYYFNPETHGGRVFLPELDLMQIHELKEVTASSNIAAGLERLHSLTTGRIFHILLCQFKNGNVLNTSGVDRIRHLFDGNTPTVDESLAQHLWRTRAKFGKDLPPGLFAFDWRKRPWDSNVWGQLQVGMRIASGFTVATAPVPYMSYLSKALYAPGAVLGGANQ